MTPTLRNAYQTILYVGNERINLWIGKGHSITADDDGFFYLDGMRLKILPATEEYLAGPKYLGITPIQEYCKMVPTEAIFELQFRVIAKVEAIVKEEFKLDFVKTEHTDIRNFLSFTVDFESWESKRHRRDTNA
jgi:hypothetical protein